MLEQQHIEEAANYPSLGPAYFAARSIAERATKNIEAEHFKPLVDGFVDKFRDTVWTAVQDSLMADVEVNIQREIWQTVDATVKALLSGEKWAVERYCLGSRYDQEAVRAAIAKHIPAELQDARIADLEASLAQAHEDVKRLREYSRY